MTSAPVVCRTREELASARAELLDGQVAVVMTMGALHEGHAALIREARERAAHVVVTIFLNPLQFGPKEDLSRYPRTFDDDLVICRREGVDVVFAPSPDVVYPDGDPGATMLPGVQPWAKAGVIVKDGTKQGSAYAAVALTGAHGVRMQDDFTHDVAGMAQAVLRLLPPYGSAIGANGRARAIAMSDPQRILDEVEALLMQPA